MQIQDGSYHKQKALDNMPILLELLDRYESEITIHKKSVSNERTLSRQSIAEFRIDQIRSEQIDELISEMLDQYKPSSIRRMLAPLSHLFNVAKQTL